MEFDPKNFNNTFRQLTVLKLRMIDFMIEKDQFIATKEWEKAAEARAQEVLVRNEIKTISSDLSTTDTSLPMSKDNFRVKMSIQKLLKETQLDDNSFIVQTQEDTEQKINYLKQESRRLIYEKSDDSMVASVLSELIEQRAFLRMLKSLLAAENKKGL